MLKMLERLMINYLAKLLRERYDGNAKLVIRSNGFACFELLNQPSDKDHFCDNYDLDIS